MRTSTRCGPRCPSRTIRVFWAATFPEESSYARLFDLIARARSSIKRTLNMNCWPRKKPVSINAPNTTPPNSSPSRYTCAPVCLKRFSGDLHPHTHNTMRPHATTRHFRKGKSITTPLGRCLTRTMLVRSNRVRILAREPCGGQAGDNAGGRGNKKVIQNG